MRSTTNPGKVFATKIERTLLSWELQNMNAGVRVIFYLNVSGRAL